MPLNASRCGRLSAAAKKRDGMWMRDADLLAGVDHPLDGGQVAAGVRDHHVVHRALVEDSRKFGDHAHAFGSHRLG